MDTSTNKTTTTPAKKLAASKPVTTAKSAPKNTVNKNTLTPEDRYHMSRLFPR